VGEKIEIHFDRKLALIGLALGAIAAVFAFLSVPFVANKISPGPPPPASQVTVYAAPSLAQGEDVVAHGGDVSPLKKETADGGWLSTRKAKPTIARTGSSRMAVPADPKLAPLFAYPTGASTTNPTSDLASIDNAAIRGDTEIRATAEANDRAMEYTADRNVSAARGEANEDHERAVESYVRPR
jgi:hypothetical protein